MPYLWNSLLNHDSSNCTLCKQNNSSSVANQNYNSRTSQESIWNSLLNHNADKCTLCSASSTKKTCQDMRNPTFKPKKQMNLPKSKITELLKEQMISILGRNVGTQNNRKDKNPKSPIKVEYVDNIYIKDMMKTTVLPSNESLVTQDVPLNESPSPATSNVSSNESPATLDIPSNESPATSDLHSNESPATSNMSPEILILNIADSLLNESETVGSSKSFTANASDSEEILCIAPVSVPNILKSTNDDNETEKENTNEDEGQEGEEKLAVSMAVLNCHECEKCCQQFVDWKEFKFHKQLCGLEYPFLCQTCGHSIPNESGYLFHLNYHKKMSTDHKCGSCCNVFCTEGALRTHLKLKNPCKTIKTLCKSCGLLSENEEKHETHCSTCTKRRPQSVCKLCNAELGRKASLDRHIKLVHEKEKFANDFICDSCGKTFSDRSALRKHMMKHAERKYKCFECGRKFIYIGNLKTHMKIHIREMNLEPTS